MKTFSAAMRLQSTVKSLQFMHDARNCIMFTPLWLFRIAIENGRTLQFFIDEFDLLPMVILHGFLD